MVTGNSMQFSIPGTEDYLNGVKSSKVKKRNRNDKGIVIVVFLFCCIDKLKQ